MQCDVYASIARNISSSSSTIIIIIHFHSGSRINKTTRQTDRQTATMTGKCKQLYIYNLERRKWFRLIAYE